MTPLEVAAQQATVPAAGDGFIGEGIFAHEGEHMSDQQLLAGGLGRFDHPRAVASGQRDRLFAKHVLAGLERGQRDLAVQVGRQADVDHVDVRIGQQVVELAVRLMTGQIHHLAGRAEVALDRAPVAGQSRGIPGGQRGDLGPFHSLVGQVMDHAHEADAGDADSQHFCNPPSKHVTCDSSAIAQIGCLPPAFPNSRGVFLARLSGAGCAARDTSAVTILRTSCPQ